MRARDASATAARAPQETMEHMVTKAEQRLAPLAAVAGGGGAAALVGETLTEMRRMFASVKQDEGEGMLNEEQVGRERAVCLFARLSVCLFVCLFVRSFVQLVCLFVCLFVFHVPTALPF